MWPQQCPPNFKLTSSLVQCTESTICCLVGGKQLHQSLQKDYVAQYMLPPHRVRHNRSRLSYRPKVLYLRPEKISTNTSPSEWGYSVDQFGEEEPKIVNIKLIKDTLDNSLSTETQKSSNLNDEENIGLPDINEEDNTDRLQYIQKLYQKYAMEFKKYNSVNNPDNLPRRKLKFAVGYKSAKRKYIFIPNTRLITHPKVRLKSLNYDKICTWLVILRV